MIIDSANPSRPDLSIAAAVEAAPPQRKIRNFMMVLLGLRFCLEPKKNTVVQDTFTVIRNRNINIDPG